ncbi:MAG: HD domain-containing protein [Clostridia bacterium]|nr:HD domain-containing protein [Clostridia bacterium]
MVMKRLYREGSKTGYILGDKTGDIKAYLDNRIKLEIGQVIEVWGTKDFNLEVTKFAEVEHYEVEDFLPTLKRPVEEVMEEIERVTREVITSLEAWALNDFFFKNEAFLSCFKKAIGGVSMHHNYMGGLAEHTLNVMCLTRFLCERYDCRKLEIAVLSAKLHDIGKIYEMDYSGPFKYTLRGEMEGHIVIGVQMIDEAVRSNPDLYSEDFITRVKGCVVQHHGKLEFGSPREMKLEEAFVLNFADTIDATMNKIEQIRENTEENQWSEYDRRIETRLYL